MSCALKPTGQWSPATVPGFFLILLLFFTGRLMLLLAFPLENLIAYSDYRYFFNSAALSQAGGCALFTGSQAGCFPFIHYWYEYPPIYPYLNLTFYYLSGQQLKNYIFIQSFTLLLFECGNLYLLYRLAWALYDRERAMTTAWIYSALFIPIFFLFSNFEALTTFLILLSLYSLVKSKHKLLALALGLGTMLKFLPIILLATVLRVRGIKAALIYGAAVAAISLVILLPFALLNFDYTLASLQAQFSKSSYQTVWALIDGNTATGNFGPLADHFDVAKATEPVNNPARFPTWLTFIPFALLGFFIFKRPITLLDNSLDAVIFTTLTFTIFFLWSRGWSPQWQTFLIPLLLLALPYRRAVLFIILLGFVNLLEWPVILSRGLTQLLPITIFARTLIFALLAVELYQRLAVKREREG
jgi:hypothetical protein